METIQQQTPEVPSPTTPTTQPVRRRISFSIDTFMQLYLGTLLVADAFSRSSFQPIFNFTLIMIPYLALDVVFAKISKKQLRYPDGTIISSLIIALVAAPAISWTAAIFLGAAAALAKQFLRFGKIRHLVNPAAFALLVAALLFPHLVSWQGTAWTIWLAPILLAAGVYILIRVRRVKMVLWFTATYLILSAVAAFVSGTNLLGIGAILLRTLFDGTFLFFLTVMLVEPITSAFPLPSQQVFYAVGTAVLAVGVSVAVNNLAVDPLIIAVVMMGIVTGIWAVRPPIAIARSNLNSVSQATTSI